MRLLINNKQPKESERSMRCCSKISRRMPTSSSPLTVVALQMNEFATAETWLKRGLGQVPRSCSLRFYLGQAAKGSASMSDEVLRRGSGRRSSPSGPCIPLGRQNKLAEARE
jgi:hypothetical protein